MHWQAEGGGAGDAEALGTLYSLNGQSVFDRLLWRMEHVATCVCESVLLTETTVALRLASLTCAALGDDFKTTAFHSAAV